MFAAANAILSAVSAISLSVDELPVAGFGLDVDEDRMRTRLSGLHRRRELVAVTRDHSVVVVGRRHKRRGITDPRSVSVVVVRVLRTFASRSPDHFAEMAAPATDRLVPALTTWPDTQIWLHASRGATIGARNRARAHVIAKYSGVAGAGQAAHRTDEWRHYSRWFAHGAQSPTLGQVVGIRSRADELRHLRSAISILPYIGP